MGNKLSYAEGDCDTSYECKGDLRCGTSNCKDFWPNKDSFVDSDDCCYNPEPRYCHRGLDDCCGISGFSCQIGDGDCDEGECDFGLKCGTNNCKSIMDPRLHPNRKVHLFEEGDDCCYDPSYTKDCRFYTKFTPDENDNRKACCIHSHECNEAGCFRVLYSLTDDCSKECDAICPEMAEVLMPITKTNDWNDEGLFSKSHEGPSDIVTGLTSALGVMLMLVVGLVYIFLKLRRRRALESADKMNLIRCADTPTTYITTSDISQEAVVARGLTAEATASEGSPAM